jgi:hypothetical protein
VVIGTTQILIEESVVEQTLGLLQWISQVLVSGRFNLAQIVGARRAAAKRGYCILTIGLRNECSWWRQVLVRWNRIAMVVPPKYAVSPWTWADSPVTDASRELSTLSGAGGAFYNGMWGLCVWTEEEVRELDIMELEALMCVLWIATLIEFDPGMLRGRRFTFRNDNQPWRDSHNANASNKPAIAVLLRWLHELQALHSFAMWIDWIASENNPISDAISRQEWERFHRVAAANHYPLSSLRRVQVTDRCTIVSLMISAKRSATSMVEAR